MYNAIARNKRNTLIIIAVWVLFFTGIAALLSWLTDNIWVGVALIGFILVYTLIQYFLAATMAMGLAGGIRITKDTNPRLWRAVENLAISEGMPMPKVYVIPDQSINAMAIGRDPWHAHVGATEGLLKITEKYELEGIMAHEMAHGYGFADEGTCNFLAFICHTNDQNPYIAYATTLGYWRYLASNVRRISPSFFNEKMRKLPSGLRKDLMDIQNYSNGYEDWMPNLQYKMYDAYLKGQGIKEGMLNYNKVIGLVLAYKAANSFILIDSSLPR